MSQSLMKMDIKVLDVLILEMTHGTVEINMILLHAHQDGLAMSTLINVLWPIQEKDLVLSLLVKTTAKDQDQSLKINIDATLPATSARNAKKEILDAHQIEPLNATTAKTQIHQIKVSINATRLTQTNQLVINALTLHLVALQKLTLANNAIQNQNSSNVIQRPSLACRLRMVVTSSKLVMLPVVTLPHKNFSEHGEVLRLRKVNHQTSKWEKLI